MSTLKVDAIGKFDTTANAITFDSNNNASFTGSVNATNPMMNKNLIINGGMNVWQRATSASVNSDIYSTVDRYVTRIRGGAAYTISRSTDVPSAQGFAYSLKFDNTTADASPTTNDFTLLEQRIEGQNLQHLLKGTSSAKALTLSFWIKSNVTGTFIARLNDIDNTRSISQAYTIDTASTWEKKIITFDADQTGTLDNDNNGSLWLQLWFSAGPDFTSTPLESTWGSTDTTRICAGISNLSSSTSNELYITGIQLEVGSTASEFEFEPFETILRKCHRYYRRWARISTEPDYVQSVYFGCFAQFFNTTQAIVHPIGLYAPFRDTPDAEYSGTTDFTIIENGNVTEYSSAAPTVYSSASVVNAVNPQFVFTTSGATNARIGRVFNRYDGTSWIAMDAEI